MTKVKVKTMLYPFLITLIGAVVMMGMLLLPYASANDEYVEHLLKHKDKMYVEEIGMTYEDAVDISLVEFIRIYAEAAEQELQKDTCIACIVIICIFAGLTVFTLLMSLLKKPIGIIIFDLLAIGVFKIIHYDFEDRGVIPNGSYDWGIASYLTYIVGIIIIAGAVWLFIEKRKAKKVAKSE